MKYSELVFDLYGTLVDIHTEESAQVWEKCAIFFGFYGAACTGEELRRAFSEELSRREAQSGQSYECYPDIAFEQVMSSLLRQRGAAGDADALGIQAAQLFRICSIEYIRVYPGVRRALETLRENGSRLWLLSNAQRVFTAYELRHLGLEDLFDGIYISSDYGCRKPDGRFFRALLTERELEPESCLMIGNDRMTDIAGAKRAGIATLYMHTALTPFDQPAADERLHPGAAPRDCRSFEFEGDDWNKLLPELIKLQNG